MQSRRLPNCTAAGVGLCFFLTLLCSTVSSRSVGYDHRALVIDGQRRFLISGSIHYPRSTPGMWPGLIALAKEGGVDVIDTYVFWDLHEPVKGKYNFQDRYDLLGFINTVHNAGLFVNLRIGPFISAEWNFGGFPRWLREIPGIVFRTDNEPFKGEMEHFVKFIVNMMRTNNLFYTQGGPIILTQIENEYRHIARWYGSAGERYINWAAAMALSLNTTVPWIMCSQSGVIPEIIITCNGFYCDKFQRTGYNTPKIWTESYTGWFHWWGQPLVRRSVEDVAFAVARFFQTGGSFMNYYMYHGGTNFERTAARGVTTSYDYGAPIDEYGQVRQPGWSHFKDLNSAIKLCAPALTAVDDEPFSWSPGKHLEVHVYNTTKAKDNSPGGDGFPLCAAFLSNRDSVQDATIEFNGQSYHVPAWSVSILPDCKKVVFNTAKVAAQTFINKMVDMTVDEAKPSNTRKAHASGKQESGSKSGRNTVKGALQWEWFKDSTGVWGSDTVLANEMLEQFNVTRDSTDYLWYTATLNLPNDQTHSRVRLWLKIRTFQTPYDVLHVFINGRVADQPPISNTSGFYQPVTLQAGANALHLLSVTNGLPHTQAWLEARFGGPRGLVTLEGLPSGNLDLTHFTWTHQVGLKGESLHLESKDAASAKSTSLWSSGPPPVNEPLVWYKATLDLRDNGTSPVALDLGSLKKGAAWINGHHLGRYWPSQINPSPEQCNWGCDYRREMKIAYRDMCLCECGEPSQRWYHVPREWMKPTGNRLVLFEEIGGNPHGVSISHQVLHSVCSHVSESQPLGIQLLGYDPDRVIRVPQLVLDCGAGKTISKIRFASFGNPSGTCGSFAKGSCHASRSEEVIEQACIGRRDCRLSVHRNAVGEDPCPDQEDLSLAVEALCTQ